MQFKEIIGQEDAKRHILDVITNKRLPHALLITGPEGVGALPFAHAITQYVNCLNPSPKDSCGKCANCTKIRKGMHLDIHYILPIISKTQGGKRYLSEDYIEGFRDEFVPNPYFSFTQWQQLLDAANKQFSISVHEVRSLKRKLSIKAFEAPYKVAIIWNAERMNIPSANALLKLLEEPPERTLLLMTCNDPSRLLTTITSRCQRLMLQRLPKEAVKTYLIEHKQLSEEQAEDIASVTEGSISKANAFTDDSTQAMRDLYIAWLRKLYVGNYAKLQEQIAGIYKENKEFQKLFLVFAMQKMRDSLMFHMQVESIALVTSSEAEFHRNFSKLVTPQKAERILDQLEKSRFYLTRNANPHMVFTVLSLNIHSILKS